MTQNQLSYMSNQITEEQNLRMADLRKQELDETERHNLEVERLNADANSINQWKAQLDADIKRETNLLNKEIASLNYNVNQGKLAVDAYEAQVQALRVQYQNWYDEQSALLHGREVDLKEDTLAEESRHNEALESISSKSNDIKEMDTLIRDKQYVFDKYAFNESNLLKWEELNIKRDQLSYDQYYRTLTTEIMQQEADTRYKQYLLSSRQFRELGSSEKFKNYSSGIGTFGKMLNDITKSVLGVFF